MAGDRNVVTVASFSWINEAEMARILLKSYNIDSEITDSEITAANPLLAIAVGGIKLNVCSGDAERAASILKEDEKDRIENYKPWCPNCESENVVKTELNGFLKVLSILTLGVAAMVLSKDFFCKDCGHKWR